MSMKKKLAELLKKVVEDNYDGHEIDPTLRDEIESALRDYDTQAFIDLEVDYKTKSIYRNSDLKKEDVFRAVFKQELEVGVDMYHYATKVERWSNQNEGKKRGFYGWRDTILNFADSDKEKSKLVMLNTEVNDEFHRLFNQ